MRYIADLEIHTKYARACSKDADLEHNHAWALRKGIDIVGTGDFTHPEWFRELQKKLEPCEPGMYRLRETQSNVRFVCSSEVSCIWSQGGKTRRVHIILHAPDLASVERINSALGKLGKLGSDGRPILGMTAERLCEVVFDEAPDSLVIPAHVWTPWFGMFGSKSGFETLEECFGHFTERIYAIETGLSSDPPMNWRLSQLDEKNIVSYSDAHSSPHLGREATVFELSELSYDALSRALRTRSNYASDRIESTIEFFPEEGMYHFDGHRACCVCWHPAETRRYHGECLVCKKQVTVGVLSRVEALADRPEAFIDDTRPSFVRLVPLPEIIANAYGIGKQSKRVMNAYHGLIERGGSDYQILLRTPLNDLADYAEPALVEGVRRVRSGELHIEPGYDGVYGRVHVFTEDERERFVSKAKQRSLF